jgi:hypothetical protein
LPRWKIPYQEPVPLPSAGLPSWQSPSDPFAVTDPVELPLIAIAHARSGDKGADANIGVRARHQDFFALLKQQLSADVIAEWFAHRIEPTSTQARNVGPVQRYELPGIHALNFVLRPWAKRDASRFDPGGGLPSLLDLQLFVPGPEAHPTCLLASDEAARQQRGACLRF